LIPTKAPPLGRGVRRSGASFCDRQQSTLQLAAVHRDMAELDLTLKYTPVAVFVGIVSINLPFVILTLQRVIEGIEQNTVDAAQSLGATPFEAWRLVTLPLAMPGILAAAVLSFILTMNAYATPVLLGGATFQMAAPVVANEVLQQANWPFGATVSFALMALTLVLTAGLNMFVGRRYIR
jgi:putative spermidine/putrescine transport system permease protein